MTGLRVLAVSVAAVVLAVVAAWMPAAADGEPLALEIDASPRTCTAGSLAKITWLIRGGEAPYRLAIDGEAVDAGAESAAVRCGSSLSDAPAWLSEAARQLTIRAEVVDAAGATADADTTLVPAPPLPPLRITAKIWQSWGDHRLATGYVYFGTVGNIGGEANAPPPGSRLYVVRWREAGERRWNYKAPGDEQEDRYPHTWKLGGLRTGAFYEFQASRLRDQIERETPDALRWSRSQTTVSAGPPRDVTAHATRNSVTVSWESNVESTEWVVSLTGHPESPDAYRRVRGPFDADKRVADSASHAVRFTDLLPGREYTVVIQQGTHSVQFEAEFDIRTEGTASEAELAAQRPRITRTDIVGDTLHVEWLPPAVGAERYYAVSAREYGVQDRAGGFITKLGATQETLTEIKPGTTYRVVVKALGGHEGRDERIIETPLDLPDDLTWRWPLAPRLRVEWVPEYGEHGGFRISWDPIEEDEIAQVKWERDGYVMSRIGPSPIVINVDQPGRYAFRARLRLGGGWTSWSGRVHAVTKPPRPRNVRIDEQAGTLRIEWAPNKSFTPVDGYRIRYEPYGDPEQEFTVREALAITIPTEHSCQGYALRVAAFSDEFGESSPVLRHVEAKERCGWLGVSFETRWAACEAEQDALTVVPWIVQGGVAPFKIAVRGHKPLHTGERYGLIGIYCQAEPSEGAHIIPVLITDALGTTRTAEIELPAEPAARGYGGPRSFEIDELRSISVFRNEVRISWQCPPETARWAATHQLALFNVVLRWRNAESPEWTYINGTATTLVFKVNNGCHWTWAGLEPGTRYEFQAAAWLRPEELEAPEWLRWSPLESVTALGDPEDLRVSRERGAVVVAWRAQPSAWAYQVVLRGAGESWWKYHLPSGNDVERAVFHDLPPDGRYEVEIITPPRVAGEPATEPGFIVPFPPH